MNSDISIILCTWNNAERLDITLNAMLSVDIPADANVELIVVNNNSTDTTEQVAKSYADKLPLVYVHEPKQGLSNARNAGLENAAGKYIIFTDDDVKPCKEWIQLYWDAFREHKDRYYFGGPIVSEFESKNVDLRLVEHGPASVKGFKFDLPDGPDESLKLFLSANWGCEKQSLVTAGGFDPNLGLNPDSNEVKVGEETQLMLNLSENNILPYYLSNASLLHWVPKDKVSLEHFAERAKASAFHLSQNNEDHSARLFGAPRWTYKQLVISQIQWQLSKIFRPLRYDKYLYNARIKGIMRSFKQKN